MTATVPDPTAPAPPAATTNPAVTIQGLTKAYGDLHAVDALDLVVPEGGVFGLIGPNGAGKTTTMLAITTLLKPDAGTIRVFGHDPVTEPGQVRAKVGWVPDVFGLYDGLTCAEYLDFFASAYRVESDRRAAQVDVLLELVELQAKRDTDVAGLSRGLQQRLSLARALVHDPKLLVADEPAAGLDPRARVELREILRTLADEQGVTVVISSHILAELEGLCDHLAIIEDGKVVAYGTPDALHAANRSSHVIAIRLLNPDTHMDTAVELAEQAGMEVTTTRNLLTGEVATEEAAAQLLSSLVAAGCQVIDFRDTTSGLESVFLRVTEGIIR